MKTLNKGLFVPNTYALTNDIISTRGYNLINNPFFKGKKKKKKRSKKSKK
jgi:hypothetical protein